MTNNRSFWDHILLQPSYGYLRGQDLYIPSLSELLREFLTHINVIKDRRNWLPFWSWLIFFCCMSYLIFYFPTTFRWYDLPVIIFYPMFILNIHSTIYLHRYCSHKAFQFSHPIWVVLFKMLVPKIVIEESFAISHYVHHQYPDQPGDPYNPKAGWWYCFLADANHQSIARDLSEDDYTKLVKLINHAQLYVNSYAQYKRWGSLSHPLIIIVETITSWALTSLCFYLLVGPQVTMAILAGISTWAFTIRTFNYKSHGSGIDKRDFSKDTDQTSNSLNQKLPGMVAGEWHSNHHVYPRSARNGFKKGELDLSFKVIQLLHKIGIIKNFNDSMDDYKKRFGGDGAYI